MLTEARKHRPFLCLLAIVMGSTLAASPLMAQINLPGVGGPGGPGPNIGPIGPDLNNTLPQVRPNLPDVRNAVPQRVDALRPVFEQNVPLRLQAANLQTLGNNGEFGIILNTSDRRLRVGQIDAGSLAADAGFQANDEILAVNRSWVRNNADLANALSAAASGDGQAWVFIDRNGQRQWIDLNFTGEQRGMLGVSLSPDAAMVTIQRVSNGSAAATAGLEVGDEVLSVNGRPIRTNAELTSAVQAAAQNDGVLELAINRNGTQQTIEATLRSTGDAVGNVNERLRTHTEAVVNDLRTFANEASDATKARYEQIHDRAVELRGDVQALAKQTGEVAQDRVDQVRTKAESLRDELNTFVNETQGELRGRLEQTRDRVSTMTENLRDYTAERVEMTRDRVSGQVDNVREFTQERMTHVRQHASNLHDRASELAANTTDAVKQRAEQVQNKAGAVRDDIGQFTNNVAGFTREKIAQVNEQIRLIREDLNVLSQDTRAEVRQAVDELNRSVNQLEAEVNGSAEATFESNSEVR